MARGSGFAKRIAWRVISSAAKVTHSDLAMKQLRVFYAAGPGHVIGTFIHWKSGQDEPFEPAVAYSAQFYEVCREFNARGYVVTACPQRGFLREGLFRLEHRPYRLRAAGGILYHLGQIWNGLGLIASAIRFRADVAIIAEGSHWFLFSSLALARVKVVPSLQSRVFDPSRHTGLFHRTIARLNGSFFARACFAIMSMPHELTDQIVELTRGRQRKFIEFLPLYRRQAFEQITPPQFAQRPFVVLYVGRIEADKGVFDLLNVARRLSVGQRSDFTFHICGDGSALSDLRRAAAEARLSDRFRCHGHCDRFKVREMYGHSHVVVVPTRTESGEGFYKVTVEAILCGRPVITSSAWTAWKSVFPEAIVEVAPNDPHAYADAIVRLSEDRQFFERKSRACLTVQTQFYDLDLSWSGAFRRVLSAVQQGTSPRAFRIP